LGTQINNTQLLPDVEKYMLRIEFPKQALKKKMVRKSQGFESMINSHVKKNLIFLKYRLVETFLTLRNQISTSNDDQFSTF